MKFGLGFVIIAAVVLWSCSPTAKRLQLRKYTFKFNDKTVGCRRFTQAACGLSLWECDGGQEFICLTNVEVAG